MEIEEQSSFRAGRTSIDKIFYITQMIEKTKAPNRKLYLIFIYLTKTYDSVQLNKTWETLDKSNVNTRFMEAIKSLHKGSSSKIKIGKPNYKRIQGYEAIKTSLQFIASSIQNVHRTSVKGLEKEMPTNEYNNPKQIYIYTNSILQMTRCY